MKIDKGSLRLSASDISNHLACLHLTQLNLAVARGLRKKPDVFDPSLQTLQERGYRHEAAYLDYLRARGLEVLELPRDPDVSAGKERTLDAMRAGVDVIAQATLTKGRWLGYADVLFKVARASSLGAWSYEPHDTKLARETKAGAVLQLCLYAHLLEDLQGILPEFMCVVPPSVDFRPHPLRVNDYLAYYRWVRTRLEAGTDTPVATTYPEPTLHCESCEWRETCESRRRQDDHLSLVAGITRIQRNELVARNVATLASFAQLPFPLFRPERGSVEALTRAREQARIQLEGRVANKPVHELLEPQAERGLARLPEPSPGDLFLDFEGDPFVGEDGLEYLFGYAWQGAEGRLEYRARWALTRQEERRAFEDFVDELMERWALHPGMHVYHFAPYEPAAIKRLMGRHGTRGDEVDRMLRGKLFVDLYHVVRQGVRASVESYSIKKLEPFFDYVRDVPLLEVGPFKRDLEATLELAAPGAIPDIDPEARKVVQIYNRDDCVSAMRLRAWLEKCRAELLAKGHAMSRPTPKIADASEGKMQEREATRQLRDRLTAGIAPEPGVRDARDRARLLLADLLEFHRREENVSWWEYYRLTELSDEDLADERKAIAGLRFERVISSGGRKTPVHRYRFPPQDVDLDPDDLLEIPDGEKSRKVGSVAAIDGAAGWVDIKKRRDTVEVHPTAVFSNEVIKFPEGAESLARLADWVASNGVDAPGPLRAGRDLLLRSPPRLSPSGRGLERQAGEDAVTHAQRVGRELAGGVLPIQGPPGAGKTYIGARMVLSLVAAGKKVGVTAVSHKVIENFLAEILKAAKKERVVVPVGRRIPSDETPSDGPIREFNNQEEALDALQSGSTQVLGGTAWVWAREDTAGAVDVLFIDEAGQLSLANALAVSQAAESLVLIGDPRQLEQPKKGSHPEGAEVSALEHLLGDRLTVPADRGLFLEESWRLHPSLCAFTSEIFYEGRLHSRPANERIRVKASPLEHAGFWFLPVAHAGNQNLSMEEVDAVARLVDKLVRPGATWTNAEGERQPLTRNDVLIVAPYNAQVNALEAQLPGMQIGTVDRFQGREAAVVIVSMASSSAEDAPRGMEFLYSLNRLNVATSRAKAACVLVASPTLFEPSCRTPRQMQLANAFCRYVELASPLNLESK